MYKIYYFNGILSEVNSSNLTWNNRSFCYGDGLFETIKIKNGYPMYLEDHFIRVIQGCKVLNLLGELPKYEICEIVEKESKKIGEGKIRLSIFRKEGGAYLPTNNHFDYSLTFESASKLTNEKNQFNIGIYTKTKKPINALSGFKSSNSLLYVLASIFSQENNFDDVIIQNENGNLIEATSSNIFIVKGRKIITPPLADGPVAGIFRKQVFTVAINTGIEIIEKTLTESDLQIADEIFLTNSIWEIKTVTHYKSKPLTNNIVQFLYKKLNHKR